MFIIVPAQSNVAWLPLRIGGAGICDQERIRREHQIPKLLLRKLQLGCSFKCYGLVADGTSEGTPWTVLLIAAENCLIPM